MTGVNSDGTVTCGADLDTNTTYSAGNGLTLNGTQLAVAFAGTGGATTVSRSDHIHSFCPGGFVNLGAPTAGICAHQTSGAAITWYDAARACFSLWSGSHLCRHEEILAVRTASPSVAIPADLWLGDRVADDWALFVSVPISEGSSDNFDGMSNITSATHQGYHCCRDPR